MPDWAHRWSVNRWRWTWLWESQLPEKYFRTETAPTRPRQWSGLANDVQTEIDSVQDLAGRWYVRWPERHHDTFPRTKKSNWRHATGRIIRKRSSCWGRFGLFLGGYRQAEYTGNLWTSGWGSYASDARNRLCSPQNRDDWNSRER